MLIEFMQKILQTSATRKKLSKNAAGQLTLPGPAVNYHRVYMLGLC